MGPSKIPTSNGKRWFITFIDDHTRITWVYLLRDKSEANLVFQNFHQMVKPNFRPKFERCAQIMGRNILPLFLGNIYPSMVLFARARVELRNKMGCRNAKIGTY